MRFALVGDHPDGVSMARALAASGRHELIALNGVPASLATQLSPSMPRFVSDFEEVLADPTVDAVIVASGPGDRPAHLRRALQSERHVLVVHPPDSTPDTAYEAALIQGDTHQLLFPLLPTTLQPALVRLAELVQRGEGLLGRLLLLEIDWREPGSVVTEFPAGKSRAALPGWDIVRFVGGEVAEVSAFTAQEEIVPDEPLLVSGRYERGGLFQMNFVPGQPSPHRRLKVTCAAGWVSVDWPQGGDGPARMNWSRAGEETQVEEWGAYSPWPEMVALFESSLQQLAGTAVTQRLPTWQDSIRSLELDDSARRSVERRRTYTLEYPEASEEVGFKGTMTLLGCGLIWGILPLLILSIWFPRLGWWIAPFLALFLILQFLRWIIPARRPAPDQGEHRGMVNDRPPSR